MFTKHCMLTLTLHEISKKPDEDYKMTVGQSLEKKYCFYANVIVTQYINAQYILCD